MHKVVSLNMVKGNECFNSCRVEAMPFELRKANRGIKAIELLTTLLATSKQVLGPHHNFTKEVSSALERIVSELVLAEMHKLLKST